MYEADENIQQYSTDEQAVIKEYRMEKIVYTITDENGIHARPAGRIVNAAKPFASDIRMTLPSSGKSADAKKLFAVMGLGVRKGDTIHIEAEGQDAAAALETLRTVLAEAGL